MLFGNSEERRFVLGYDLGEKVSQISFLASDADMPETLSVLAGSELYNIPTVLCKKNDRMYLSARISRMCMRGKAAGRCSDQKTCGSR